MIGQRYIRLVFSKLPIISKYDHAHCDSELISCHICQDKKKKENCVIQPPFKQIIKFSVQDMVNFHQIPNLKKVKIVKGRGEFGQTNYLFLIKITCLYSFIYLL